MAIDGTTVNNSTFRIYDQTLNQYLSGTYSLSAYGMTVYFVPAMQLATGRTYSVYFSGYGMTDLAGNTVPGGNFSFTNGFATSTTVPQVTGVSPANGLTKVPINAQIVVSFNEPVNGESLGGVTLPPQAGSPAGLSLSLGTGNQLLTITPVAGLLANTTYTLTINGVADQSANAMTTPVTSTFTTGGAPDLTALSVLSLDPGEGSVLPLNAVMCVRVNKHERPVAKQFNVYRR